MAEDKRLPSGKWLYEGKEYDYIIPTEIEEDFGVVRKLKLPYNKDSKSLTSHCHVRSCKWLCLPSTIPRPSHTPSPTPPIHPPPPLPSTLPHPSQPTHGLLHSSS